MQLLDPILNDLYNAMDAFETPTLPPAQANKLL